MNVGIVGAEGAKFSPPMQAEARRIIREILALSSAAPGATVVSGGCHLGGVDIWAEEEARAFGLPTIVHKPARRSWEDGYKPRNLLIARDSDIVHCIVVAGYWSGYQGMRFKLCYHCRTDEHVKSGGCWTAKRAKAARWHVVPVIEPGS